MCPSLKKLKVQYIVWASNMIDHGNDSLIVNLYMYFFVIA